MDKLRAIHYFITTVELGGFSAAASHFNVPASSVSRRVADLEKHLDSQLIHRTTRVVNLTEAGEIYYQQVKRLVQLEYESEQRLKAYQSEPSGTLTISCLVGFGQGFLIPAVNELRQQYPQLKIQLDLTDSLTKLANGEVDIAIRGGFAPDERVRAIKLMSNEFVPISSPAYLSKAGLPLKTTDLFGHKGLFYLTPGGPTRWWSQIEQHWRDVSGEEVLVTNSGTWLIERVLAGDGISLLPRWSVQPYLDDGSLIELGFDQPLTVNPNQQNMIYLLYRPSQFGNPKVQLAVEYLCRRLQRDDG